ncbi:MULTISPECIES: Yip1 family protein [unclassified Microbulbifer]|uniref:YIP1 family protein n=1 Tax=Microbulbifer spongiae TaxID=2944933 RepID=A0ABY9EEN3_9GAMM|nr:MULTISPECIES: Yip1 family protein [unclassified Microbulbifer]MDP5209404.1 Yip1 family protein [Microbulbifer sp. 2205BS26-8]WKD49206.1 YIP1 family protein [Microbulbifer sp. MI-G]
MLIHMFGLMMQPRRQWQLIGNLSEKNLRRQIPYVILLALLPAVAWYFGTTKIGWSIGGGDPVKITGQSALELVAVFYCTMVLAVVAIGYFIHWMAKTYGAETHPMKGVVVAGFTATPIFLAGIAGVYPLLWLDILLATVAVAYAVYLLYLGIPIVMGVSEERGFLFASAIVTVSLVVAVLIMVGTVLFWSYVSAPVFY